ncbi:MULTISPECIES: O-antigen ligase [unclassified Ruminococcus]|uniref:O-antigen ligase family protein n=1 Tax=unclassified Ruminococcus TaxID=2608920 RepID=UPI002108B859|nr:MULTISPECIES: O-antigen ligase family protein [unclassified Ruminococcus]MCQ4022556.1 hypothetical protein [Ruminococcus sp. zg-924]MCQ4114796.1 hypothetical protein [Ruminococcus sp. zg-921]
MILITSYVFFVDYAIEKYYDVYRFLIKLTVIYAVFVFLQYFLKDTFNNIYFSLLNDSYSYVANHYYNQGYYFGLIFNPHEIAALLSITIVALLLWQIINRKKNVFVICLIIVLLIPLLLSQKKAVIFLSFIAFFLVVCVMFASKKQWIRLGVFLVVVVLGYYILTYYISNNPDSDLFYRLAQFLDNVNSGESYDSGRSVLYDYAWAEFEKHKLFGIGWKSFNSLTTTVFGYASGHEVNMDYLQWLCETGIVGFTMNMIPVLVTLYRTIYICVKYVKNMTNNKAKCAVMVAIFSQFFTVMYAFFEIPFYDIVLFTLYILSCIVINSAYKEARRRYSHQSHILRAGY